MKTLELSRVKPKPYLPGYVSVSLRFEWLFTGLYLDGWAHNNIPE